MPSQNVLKLEVTKQEPTPSLSIPERAFIIALVFFLLVLTLVTQLTSPPSLPKKTGNPHFLTDARIPITIEGAVAAPGNYLVEKGTTVGALLEKAAPLPDADLRHIKLDAPIKRRRHIKIATRPKISVTVTGAVRQPGTYLVPKGTRLEELEEKVELEEWADRKALKKRRYLKDGETIHIKSY